MSDKPTMGVSVNFSTKKNTRDSSKLNSVNSNSPQTQPDSPFRIAVMGDFSGRQNSKQKLIEIDRDSFDDVMADLDIQLSLNFDDDQHIKIELKELEDFHPDALYEQLESFEHLRSLRRRLKSKNGFASASAEIQSWLPAEKISTDTLASQNTTTELESNNILDSILDTQKTTQASESSQIDALIKSIVAPYVEPVTDPRQEEMLAMVDAATQTHMRNILHHPKFQAMESAWQSLYFLIKRLETGASLKIFLLDINKQSLQKDLSIDELSTSSIYKLFCDNSEGDLPWSILLGNYQFTDNIDDVLSLVNLGEIAQQIQAPFITSASEKLAGCESLAKYPDHDDWCYQISEGTQKAWTLLRESSVAEYIALALPRFLLRLPYGEKSKPVEAFKFEEMTDENHHEDYLWGNAAFIKTESLARNFLSQGWNMQAGEIFQTENFPLYYFKEDGEMVNKPVAEISLTDKGAEKFSDNGLISLCSVKNSDCIRSKSYQSISSNNKNMHGRWK